MNSSLSRLYARRLCLKLSSSMGKAEGSGKKRNGRRRYSICRHTIKTQEHLKRKKKKKPATKKKVKNIKTD